MEEQNEKQPIPDINPSVLNIMDSNNNCNKASHSHLPLILKKIEKYSLTPGYQVKLKKALTSYIKYIGSRRSFYAVQLLSYLKKTKSSRALMLDILLGDRGLTSLAKFFKRIRTLNTLSLNFASWCNLSESILKIFCKSLKMIKDLKTLTLNLSNFNNLTQASTTLIARSITKIRKLERLTMDFSCSVINDSNLITLAKHLEKLNHLTVLNLSFSVCHRLSDIGIRKLGTSLQKIRSLRSLSINFSYCNLINDTCLVSLGSSLVNMKSLKVLNLNFSFCGGISDLGVDSFRRYIEGMKCLKSLKISFQCCNKITDPVLNLFGKSFQHICIKYKDDYSRKMANLNMQRMF